MHSNHETYFLGTLLCILFLLPLKFVNGQETVRGKILQIDGLPLSGATVRLNGPRSPKFPGLTEHLLLRLIPAAMDGRIMTELLAGSSAGSVPRVKRETIETSMTGSWGNYKLTLDRSLLGKHSYVNFTKVTRRTTPDTSKK